MKDRTTLVRLTIEHDDSPMNIVLDALNSSETKGEAAQTLGVSRSALDNWMKRLGIQSEYVVKTKNPSKSA